ncbi:hypothetical protein [Imtechella halotolerans]|uniref:DoxX family protein n=1 Tax=Imtechella halotolerans K1 TaxID=946077 RepID=I0WJE5_9FLAO|nr:hypothetical protein [Imtechella halotolerans]EID76511.1 hypothetical protein W5A_00770 [Imtechella halotolerans K1]WMQ62918.1 DoxX family protein [Imtechella halotolerans]
MDNILHFASQLLILLLLIITFLQSGWDKISDWKGNLEWLKGHFSKTILKNMVPIALLKVLVLEIFTSILCIIGFFNLVIEGNTLWAFYGCIMGTITLLMLLLGQRLAKDYDGARTIVIYLIPAIMGVYLLSPA